MKTTQFNLTLGMISHRICDTDSEGFCFPLVHYFPERTVWWILGGKRFHSECVPWNWVWQLPLAKGGYMGA